MISDKATRVLECYRDYITTQVRLMNDGMQELMRFETPDFESYTEQYDLAPGQAELLWDCIFSMVKKSFREQYDDLSHEDQS